MGRGVGEQRRRRHYPVYAGFEAHHAAAGHLFQGEDAQKQPENGEKQGKAEVSRAILFLKHGSRSY